MQCPRHFCDLSRHFRERAGYPSRDAHGVKKHNLVLWQSPTLPNKLQCKLNFPGGCPRRVLLQLTYAASARGSVRAENCRVAVAAARLGRHEANPVQDVEHLGPELDVE